MFAIIEEGGKQFRVEEGLTLEIDFRKAPPGESLTFDRVLLVGDEKGVRVGKPLVQGAKVTAEVIGPWRGPKLEVTKVRRRKSSRRHTGHRQNYLRVRVTSIQT